MNGFTPDDGAERDFCTCLWSNTATSATIHNADTNCPVHGRGATK